MAKADTLHEKARDVAAEAALRAGRLIQQHAGRVDPGAVRDKGVHDLVSEVDEEAQRVIIEVLNNQFPGFEVLGEEGSSLHPANPVADGYRWIIDPIDGTTNFLHGVPPYAVSIGLQREQEVVAGVVLDVPRGELFTAVRGGGLFVNGARAHVSTTARLHDSLITTGFPYRALEHLDPYLKVFGDFMGRTTGIRRPGSAAVDLAYVAMGRFDGFFETGLMPWDVAAGQLLVEEGGGRVSDYGDAPDPMFAGNLLASNGLIHAEMLEVLRPLHEFEIVRSGENEGVGE
ncbi:MAG TPA: inositol monophosphatase family protein [Rhodothermales bacterium]|nr:inositol monophosphatase family protein [Rhodothermales bacterium]